MRKRQGGTGLCCTTGRRGGFLLRWCLALLVTIGAPGRVEGERMFPKLLPRWHPVLPVGEIVAPPVQPPEEALGALRRSVRAGYRMSGGAVGVLVLARAEHNPVTWAFNYREYLYLDPRASGRLTTYPELADLSQWSSVARRSTSQAHSAIRFLSETFNWLLSVVGQPVFYQPEVFGLPFRQRASWYLARRGSRVRAFRLAGSDRRRYGRGSIRRRMHNSTTMRSKGVRSSLLTSTVMTIAVAVNRRPPVISGHA